MKKTMYGHPAAGRRMMVARVFTTLAMFMMVGTTMMADSKYTRGIGQYPGRTADYKGPEMVKDDAYRNVALDRAAYASSSFDYNLTAQLATDGIVTAGEPARLTVSTPDGVLSFDRTLPPSCQSPGWLCRPMPRPDAAERGVSAGQRSPPLHRGGVSHRG